MKLYVYSLKDYMFTNECDVCLEVCECEEKPKTYKVLNPSPCGYLSISKRGIGRVSYGLRERVVLTERNDDLAIELFVKHYKGKLKVQKDKVKKEESKLKSIQSKGVIEL